MLTGFEGQETDRSTTEITVMWYYTKQFDDITSNPADYIELLNSHANTAYQNSNLNLRLKTKCIERLPSNIRETSNILRDFIGAKGSSSALRQNADIALLVTSRSISGICGQVSSTIISQIKVCRNLILLLLWCDFRPTLDQIL